LSGVLNWAIEGCRRYLEDGLHYPSQVTEATAQYKADSDVLGRFIGEHCVTGAGSVTARTLYQEFSKWTAETGEQGISETAFGLRMKERGFQKQRTNRGMAYSGIGLRALGMDSNGFEG
jgi:putative DNA primase/helicase